MSSAVATIVMLAIVAAVALVAWATALYIERRARRFAKAFDSVYCGMLCEGGSERRKCVCTGPRDCHVTEGRIRAGLETKGGGQ